MKRLDLGFLPDPLRTLERLQLDFPQQALQVRSIDVEGFVKSRKRCVDVPGFKSDQLGQRYVGCAGRRGRPMGIAAAG